MTQPLEETRSCWGCQKSVALFGELHCTKSGDAVLLETMELCNEFKDLTDEKN